MALAVHLAQGGSWLEPEKYSPSLCSFQSKIGHKAARQNPILLPNRRVVFLAAHLKMLD